LQAGAMDVCYWRRRAREMQKLVPRFCISEPRSQQRVSCPSVSALYYYTTGPRPDIVPQGKNYTTRAALSVVVTKSSTSFLYPSFFCASNKNRCARITSVAQRTISFMAIPISGPVTSPYRIGVYLMSSASSTSSISYFLR
jgi:hypothetical protein